MTGAQQTLDLPDAGACPALAVSHGWAAWWLTGWQRKYRALDARNDAYVARVFSRLLDAEDRYQRENLMGKYAMPNKADTPSGP